MKVFRNKVVSKKFLVAASAYRRMARGWNVDFSLASLVEQYRFETYGEGVPDESKNGYTLGKKWLSVTIEAMHEDYKMGLFAKAELMQSCAYVRRVVKNWMSVPLFGYTTTAPVDSEVRK